MIDADGYDLLQHPFIAGYDNKKEILNLIMESKAEVVETVEDLPEDQEIIEMKVCNLLLCTFMNCCKSHKNNVKHGTLLINLIQCLITVYVVIT